jgi:hypothetical protein
MLAETIHENELVASDVPIKVAMNMHSAYGTDRFFVYHSSLGTSIDYAILEQDYIEGVRYYFLNVRPVNIEKNQQPIAKINLMQNYPNPFNPTTYINYELQITNYVELSIYNLLGQKVAVLVSEKQAAGKYAIEWDASQFSSDMYYYMIKTGDIQNVKRMILLR